MDDANEEKHLRRIEFEEESVADTEFASVTGRKADRGPRGNVFTTSRRLSYDEHRKNIMNSLKGIESPFSLQKKLKPMDAADDNNVHKHITHTHIHTYT